MKNNRNIKKVILIAFGVIIISLIMIGIFIFSDIFQDNDDYYAEYNQIRNRFSNMEGVRLIDIWGNKDFTYENISVSLDIQDKGVIKLINLSDDFYNYPITVDIGEISGILFFGFYCEQSIKYGFTLDIGKSGYLSRYFNNEFGTPEDVIERFDEVLKIVTDSIPVFPSFGHYFDNNGREAFICTHDSTINVQDILAREKNIDWSNKECISSDN